MRRLARALKGYGVKVWLDEWELKVGDSLHTKIEAGIQNSSYMLVVLSRSSLKSGWVRREMNAGLARELVRRKVYVIPALLDVTPRKLPPMLVDKLAADFRQDFQGGLRAVLGRLGITDRLRHMDYPTVDDIQQAHNKLPWEQRNILVSECSRCSRRRDTMAIFETQYLDANERRALMGLVRRDLVRVRLIKKGPYWDDSEGEMFGWVYEGQLTNLGLGVAEMEKQRT